MLWTIPDRELYQLPSLTYLNVDIRDMGISRSVCSLSFGNLDFSHNDLKYVSSGAFENAKHLKVLILDTNQIYQVNDGALNGLKNIENIGSLRK